MTSRLDRIYAEARGLSVPAALVRTLSQMLVFWAMFLWALPTAIHWAESKLDFPLGVMPDWKAAGALVFVLASSLGVWSAIAMSVFGRGTPIPMHCAPKLVVRGPYQWVRNPMAVAGIAQGIAVGLMFRSSVLIAYAIAGGLLWHIGIRPSEERDLVARFGDEYLAYRDGTPVWRPRLKRLGG